MLNFSAHVKKIDIELTEYDKIRKNRRLQSRWNCGEGLGKYRFRIYGRAKQMYLVCFLPDLCNPIFFCMHCVIMHMCDTKIH